MKKTLILLAMLFTTTTAFSAIETGGSHAIQATDRGGSYAIQAIETGGSHTIKAIETGGSHAVQAIETGGSISPLNRIRAFLASLFNAR